MVKSMKGTYCKKGDKTKCRPFTDGTKVCMCAKGWSVFFASINKMGADETKPRPKSRMSEAYRSKLAAFIEATLKSADLPENSVPRWVGLAQKVLKSPKFNDKIKTYWRKRLQDWCKKNPKNKACKVL